MTSTLLSAAVLASAAFTAAAHAQPQHRWHHHPARPDAAPYVVAPPQQAPLEFEQAERGDDAFLYFPYTVSGLSGI